ncbi:alginate lyase family protein [Limnoraphis robusta]|uniref:Alginate lyase family protein n=1 Tax=Limnoraphis robusta CCNP1315 TaxID=3110306 RepID=A0ABU5TZ16_9CYAN|nr:alginate lyase family protein [Limnoraphis robusta]MEA5520045.1 alginate lyase family protein [Limnoraphis robusta CCNP1315]MEA5548772.1 alginate lyase family protein [Limnoraphis robusta CCNP1324]
MIDQALNIDLFYDGIQKFKINLKKAGIKIKKGLIYPFNTIGLISINTPQRLSQGEYHVDWSLMSLEDLCQRYPQRIKNLFSNLNLEIEGLKITKIEVSKGNWLGACKALLEYYRNDHPTQWHHQLAVQPNSVNNSDPDLLLKDIFTFQLASSQVPRLANHHLDWSYKGKSNDEQWAWFLNRHYHFIDLLMAYQQTGKPYYIGYLNHQIIDWILSSPSLTNPSTWAQWRGLEVAWRMIHWSSIFYHLQPVQEFSDVARILMLSSIPNHGYYLRHLHSWGANWLCREMNGLATISLYWPEFKQAKEWLKYAKNRFIKEIDIQVYPDGVHKELTSHYHRVTMNDFQSFARLLTQADQFVPLPFKKRLEQMWNYLAYSMRPDGSGVLNNDSDRDENQQPVQEAAITYDRPDWTYITTNGKLGLKPIGEPSVLFPWAGQMIMRNGWDTQDHWAFFDIGPMGINYHIHNDKLHLSIAAYGRDLLVDSGRYSYVRSPYWRYFRGSASHNVILVDGGGQKMDIREARRPLVENINYSISSELDYARGQFDQGFQRVSGTAIHTRSVVYLHDQYWIVVDQIITNRPRKLETLWHFHPDCTVVVEGDSVGSVDAGLGNLKIIPASPVGWMVNLIQGQENPVQGWWSREYNHKQPNPTAIYSTQIQASTCFAWVLVPAKDRVPTVTVNLLSSSSDAIILSVKIGDRSPATIAVNFNKNLPLEVSPGVMLVGDCGVFREGQAPVVACGSIVSDQVEEISSSSLAVLRKLTNL